ncbi:MAG: hypothetical protein K2M14_07820 [Muribaculaceae bacterium]|nr:hypothetical protein [Bacteroidales bacterium]MDE6243898.1 hypothetical protein [Muribaculaceae bacterium]
MVTKEVINEIYKKYSTPPKDVAVLDLPHYIELLKKHHNLSVEDDELINRDLEEFHPFRRFLVRRLTAVLNFDKVIAFVFNKHIIFFEKNSNKMHVHFKPEKQSLISRLFRHS